eukprot:768511-Hanusia_phi.AAC.1
MPIVSKSKCKHAVPSTAIFKASAQRIVVPPPQHYRCISKISSISTKILVVSIVFMITTIHHALLTLTFSSCSYTSSLLWDLPLPVCLQEKSARTLQQETEGGSASP